MSQLHENLEQMMIILKVDGSYEYELISSLLFSAEEFLKRAGVEKPTEKSHLYDLAVKMYVTEQYTNREIEVRMPLRSIQA
jgi:uncharacterized phage protein (predicted DNA packaging)